MKKIISFFIVALLLSIGTVMITDKTAVGQGCPAKSGAKPGKSFLRFDDCDKGNTGALTFKEAQACWPNLDRKTFDAIDTDKNDKITKQELKENRERYAKTGTH